MDITESLHFPNGFVWGTGSSSHQVEGDNTKNDWWEFEQTKGRIANGEVSGRSINQYELFDEDFALCERFHHNAHRFSIEWSRIIPEAGVVNQKEVDHYKRVFDSLHKHNLEPFPTMHHFCVPQWFAKRGRFEVRENLAYWEQYAEVLAREFVPYAKKWFTINEPGAYAFAGYLAGEFPPNTIAPPLAYDVYENIMRAHAIAYHILKAAGAEEVNLVKAVTHMMPADPANEKDVRHADFMWGIYTGVVLDALRDGVFQFPPQVRREPSDVPELKGATDVFGVTYYQRTVANAKRPWDMKITMPEDEIVSQMGQGCYPAGLNAILHRCAKELPGVPLMVAENGFCTEDDRERVRFLLGHLAATHAAIRDGLDVRGYLYWTLIDNFEWTKGWTPKFGLVACDRTTFARTPRPSAYLFADVAEANAVTPELAEQYLTQTQGLSA